MPLSQSPKEQGRTDHLYCIKIHVARLLLGEIQEVTTPKYVKSSSSLSVSVNERMLTFGIGNRNCAI